MFRQGKESVGMRRVRCKSLILTVFAIAVSIIGAQLVAVAQEGGATGQVDVVELTLEDTIRLAVSSSNAVKIAMLDQRLAEIALLEQTAMGEENVSAEARKSAEQAYADAQKAVEDAIKSAAVSAESSYYSLLKAFDRVASAERALEVSENQLETVRVKFEAGIENKSALESAEQGVVSAEKSLRDARFALETEMIRFNLGVGLDISTQVRLVHEFKYEPVEVDLEESIAFAMENRDDIQKAVLSLEKAQTDLERRRQIPGYTKIDIERAEISLVKAEMSLESTRTNALIAVRNAYSGLLAAAATVESAAESIEKAKDALTKAQTRYDAGLATLNSLKDAERALIDAETKYAQSVYDYNMAYANFCQAIGIDYISVDMIKIGNGESAD